MWEGYVGLDAERSQSMQMRLIIVNLSYSVPALEASSRTSWELRLATTEPLWWFLVTVITTLHNSFLGCDLLEVIITIFLSLLLIPVLMPPVTTISGLLTFLALLRPVCLRSGGGHSHAGVVIVLLGVNNFRLLVFQLCFALELRHRCLLAGFLLLSTFSLLSHCSKLTNTWRICLGSWSFRTCGPTFATRSTHIAQLRKLFLR